MASQNFELHLEFNKVDEASGIVYGWGIICTKDGTPYFDLQGDHIPDDAMQESTTDFAINSRVVKDMHSGDPQGFLVHSFPLTKELQDSLGIKSKKTGWVVGVKPNDTLMAKCVSGEHTGFSIGGFALEIEETTV